MGVEICYTINEERKVQSNENLVTDFKIKENMAIDANIF